MTPTSVDMRAITESAGKYGGVTLMWICSSALLIMLDLPCAKTSFAKPWPNGEWEWNMKNDMEGNRRSDGERDKS